MTILLQSGQQTEDAPWRIADESELAEPQCEKPDRGMDYRTSFRRRARLPPGRPNHPATDR